jgi:multidrug efflux pump subunit AcrB
MAIRKSLLGQNISTYTLDEESHDIVVRFDRKNRNNFNMLLDQRLVFRNNKGKLMNIPIRSVINDPEESTSYSAVIRKDQIPLVTITSNVTEGFNANEVVKVLKKEMGLYESKNSISDKINYRFAGQQDEQAKELAFFNKSINGCIVSCTTHYCITIQLLLRSHGNFTHRNALLNWCVFRLGYFRTKLCRNHDHDRNHLFSRRGRK